MKIKPLFLFVSIMVLFFSSGFSDPPSEKTANRPELSRSQRGEPKFVEEILSEYERGVYNPLFEQINRICNESRSQWESDALLERRKKKSSRSQDIERIKGDDFAKKSAKLRENEVRELVELCLSEPVSSLTRNIKDMAFFTPSRHERESLGYIDSLSEKSEGEGETPFEEKLIKIETEFLSKMLALDLRFKQNSVDQEVYIKQRAALQLEKLKQMRLLTKKSDADPKIKGYIETACKIYPYAQISCIIRDYLDDLAIGNAKPQTITEEKLREIALRYYKEKQRLIKQYLSAD